MAPSQLTRFRVTRREPELIPPARTTPHEFKPVSDVDDQGSLRVQEPMIIFYPGKGGEGENKDPVKVIREAIAEALVYYYPLAGRLREGNGKLEVECTGEGVLFIEADADVSLAEFGDDALRPPFPCAEELLYNVPGSAGIVDCPLLLIQVTRLKCGAFAFGLRLNHIMGDATGQIQFMAAVGEIARGAETPSVPPVWERHLLNAQDPPRITCKHNEYDHTNLGARLTAPLPTDKIICSSYFFGATEISRLRKHLPPHLQSCSKFELVVACLWRCRTIAISPDPNEHVRLFFPVNARSRFDPPLPSGYYGNAFALAVAISKVDDLVEQPLHYAVDLVMKAKSSITEEYIRSLASLVVTRDRPRYAMGRTSYLVSDVTRGFAGVDFGWGKPLYGGPLKGKEITGSFYIPCKNSKDEDGHLVIFGLDADAMAVFMKELEAMMDNK